MGLKKCLRGKNISWNLFTMKKYFVELVCQGNQFCANCTTNFVKPRPPIVQVYKTHLICLMSIDV